MTLETISAHFANLITHTAPLTLAPRSADELAQVLAACHAQRMPVVPWGGGTRQSWGRPVAAAEYVVVRTTGLSRVLAYTPDDLTISVEAGMTMAELDALLAANGQMLPIDVPLPARSTVGGMLATAADGPRRLGYGTARDLLIGVGVVEATGRPSKAGGMVVKNVSGFDMMKLYMGSLGTLAVIVSANFKLMPRPRAAAGLLAEFPRPAAAFALVEAIHASQLTPVAVEYLEGYALTEGGASETNTDLQKPMVGSDQGPTTDDHAADQVGPSSFVFGSAHTGSSKRGATVPAVAIWAEGLPAAVERHVRDLGAMAEQAGATGFRVARDEAHRALWAAVADLPRSDDVAEGELAVRLSCLPAQLAEALVDARAAAASHGLSLKICARALSGVAYLRLAGPAEGLRAAHAELLRRRPQLTLLAAPPALAAELPAWGDALPNLELMRRIKGEFDPQGLLNPGRFVVSERRDPL